MRVVLTANAASVPASSRRVGGAPERRDFAPRQRLAVTLIPFGDVPKVTVRLVFAPGTSTIPKARLAADLTGAMLGLAPKKLDAVSMAAWSPAGAVRSRRLAD